MYKIVKGFIVYSNVLLETFSRETLGKQREQLNPWFVSGLCEADAVFTFSRNGNHLSLYFALKQLGTDRRLLEAIRAFFGNIGQIYSIKNTASEELYFRVTRLSECEMIVAHFKEYPLRGIKHSKFLLWGELLLLKKKYFRKRRWNPEDLKLQDQLLQAFLNAVSETTP